MTTFDTTHEAFNAGYAVPRWDLVGPQSWVYYHMVYHAEKDTLPLEDCMVGNAPMRLVKIEELIAKATDAKLNENLQSRVNSINML